MAAQINMTKFVSDSSADYLKIEGVNFISIPLSISTDRKTYTDDELLDPCEMLSDLEAYQGRSYTACPGTQAWLKAYEGGDRIYVCALTSLISGTYNSALLAAQLYTEKHPGVQIHVFDSLTTGPCLRLLVEKVIELDQSGLPFEEVIRQAELYMKTTRLYFAFQSLHNFAQNGRVNKVLAAAISTFGIRIIGTASPEGNIDPITKSRGDKKTMDQLLSMIREAGCCGRKIKILHADNPSLAETYCRALQNIYPAAEIEVYQARGLCSYYAERGGIIVGFETV